MGPAAGELLTLTFLRAKQRRQWPQPDRLQALREYVALTWRSPRTSRWMLQQLLQGTEFSSYSVAHEGHLILHCDTVACASNLRYARCGRPSGAPPALLPVWAGDPGP